MRMAAVCTPLRPCNLLLVSKIYVWLTSNSTLTYLKTLYAVLIQIEMHIYFKCNFLPLLQMAFLRVNKGWEFLMDQDQEFIHRHQDVFQRQQMIWDAMFQQLAKVRCDHGYGHAIFNNTSI